LLKHDEVVTLFHELGHGIHDLVARTTYSRFHGTATVRDFVEAPSQMLENWCWSRGPLRSLSKHYSYISDEFNAAYIEGSEGKPQPPEQMDDALLDNLFATKHILGSLFNLRQLHFGTFDMAIHAPASHDAVEKMDPTALYNSMRANLTLLSGPESFPNGNNSWGNGEATFGHLMVFCSLPSSF
jgi:metallopeptidase MepB